ncbi:MAG: DUF805 domain-containing protein [Sphingomonadaceae bacterium]
MSRIFKVLQNYAKFTGRASRFEFWTFAIFFGIVTTLAHWLDKMGGNDMAVVGRFGLIELVASLLLMLPFLSAGTRRLHDTGRTGWWLMILYVPYLSWTVAEKGSSTEMLSLGGIIVGFFSLIILLALPGSPASNRFGPPTAANR